MVEDKEQVLIMSPNWLGDAIMAMPAVKEFRRLHPGAHTIVLAKPAVASLWKMHDSVDEVVDLPPGNGGTFRAARALRDRGIFRTVILPNSFRSALIPFLARIGIRRGTASNGRSFLITDRVEMTSGEKANLHQSLEYMKLLCAKTEGDIFDTGFKPSAPSSALDPGFDRDSLIVGIIPGAARGDSKRWPYFAEAAKLVANGNARCRFIVAGSAGEGNLCAAVASEIGDKAVNLAGKTNLAEFAALLGLCHVVLCNDSGGMHLASAAGVPVVAVYGITDPRKTGPIGKGASVVQAEGVRVSRDVPRSSPEAVAALKSVPPEKVAGIALQKLLG